MIIPSNLNECFVVLDDMKIQDMDKNLKMDEDSFVSLSHFGLGQWIRNEWGLWYVTKTPFWKDTLQGHFRDMGLHHPDDMSGVILRSYHRLKNGKDLDLSDQIRGYMKFWENQNKRDKKPKKL
jgi:hypothetical protein